MDMMVTFFPTKDCPLRINGGANYLKDSDKLCVSFDCGSSYVTLHSVTPDMVRAFAAQLVDAVDKAERNNLVSDDVANRTPDANLDRTEREDIPEDIRRRQLTHPQRPHIGAANGG